MLIKNLFDSLQLLLSDLCLSSLFHGPIPNRDFNPHDIHSLLRDVLCIPQSDFGGIDYEEIYTVIP